MWQNLMTFSGNLDYSIWNRQFLVLIWMIILIHDLLKDFLSLHSQVILDVLGLGGNMLSPSAFVALCYNIII